MSRYACVLFMAIFCFSSHADGNSFESFLSSLSPNSTRADMEIAINEGLISNPVQLARAIARWKEKLLLRPYALLENDFPEKYVPEILSQASIDRDIDLEAYHSEYIDFFNDNWNPNDPRVIYFNQEIVANLEIAEFLTTVFQMVRFADPLDYILVMKAANFQLVENFRLIPNILFEDGDEWIVQPPLPVHRQQQISRLMGQIPFKSFLASKPSREQIKAFKEIIGYGAGLSYLEMSQLNFEGVPFTLFPIMRLRRLFVQGSPPALPEIVWSDSGVVSCIEFLQ